VEKELSKREGKTCEQEDFAAETEDGQ